MAAAVVVVAGGVAVGLPTWTAPAGRTNHDDPELGRCAATVGLTDEIADSYADPKYWSLVDEAVVGDKTVLSIRAENRALFCETTLYTVTVSRPVPLPARGDAPRLAFITGTGTVAGTVDPAATEALPTVDGVPVTAAVRSGFWFSTGDNRSASDVGFRTDPSAPVTPLPEPQPTFGTTDRKPVRTRGPADAEAFLAACLESSPTEPSIATAWRAGALATTGPVTAVVTRTDIAEGDVVDTQRRGHMGLCARDDTGSRFTLVTEQRSPHLVFTQAVTSPGNPTAVFGAVGPTAAAVTVEWAERGIVDNPALVDGTFVVRAPETVVPSEGRITVTAADGTLLYRGPLVL